MMMRCPLACREITALISSAALKVAMPETDKKAPILAARRASSGPRVGQCSRSLNGAWGVRLLTA